jgi:tetratricopeptide (TPR) repeat protein
VSARTNRSPSKARAQRDKSDRALPSGQGGDPVERNCADGSLETWPAGSSRNYWLLVGLAFAIAVAFRILFLHADPPWNFTWSQDLFTDGARVVDGARNKVLFGDWIIDPRSPGAVFYPISSVLAWLVFKIGGVGLAQANVTGLLPGLASLVLIYFIGRKLEGRIGGLVALVLFGFSYLHVIYSRVPMVESMLMLMLLAAFRLALGGRLQLFLAGLLIALASFMVKLHALHLLPVIIVYLVLVPDEALAGRRRSHLVASLAAGFAAGTAVWLGAIYAQHPAALDKYFTSNVFLAQKADYQGLSVVKAIERRIAGVIHVGAGRDGYQAKTAEVSMLAFISLLGIASRFSLRKATLKPYELFSVIWFVCLLAALGLMSYRPLRYLALLTPCVSFLAMSLLMRLARGEQVIATPRPRWFVYFFGFWLVWIVIHIQQEAVFEVMTGGRVLLVNEMNAFQKMLYKYQFMVLRQLLIWGSLGIAFTLFFHGKLSRGETSMSLRRSRGLFIAAMLIIVAAGTLRFALYAADRKYSVIEASESLTRVFSDGVFLAGDCSALIALETDFKTLPSYGDLIRYKEKAAFERYPITHFILRFPTLFNYLSETYPDLEDRASSVRILGLCGREATIIRYEGWPGTVNYPYHPTLYEQATLALGDEDTGQARELFQAFLEQHPDSYEALWGMALCDFRDERLEEARVLIERALELTHRDALCYEAYADILNSLGEIDRCVKYYKKALELSPNSRRLMRKLNIEREVLDE